MWYPSKEEFARLLQAVPESSSESDEDPAPALLRSSSHNMLRSYKNLPNIYKWNIQFNEDMKHGSSVHNFLERVEEMARARNVSDSQLFESAIDLFSGREIWFRSNRDRFNDWKGLSNLLVKHYEPADYRQILFHDIMSRTQDPSESIIDYLTCVKSMFRRYGNVEEDVKLNIISRNLAPFYSTQLPSVTSLQELEDASLQLALKKYRADNYVPPSRKKQSYVEPDFAFVFCHVNAVSGDIPQPSTSSGKHSRNCWNCQKLGHTRQNCPEPRKLICYRCDEANVSVRNCPHCSSGNASRRS